MSSKAKRPCVICGRGMAIHRGKRKVCGRVCSAEVRRLRRQQLTDTDLRASRKRRSAVNSSSVEFRRGLGAPLP